MNNSDGHVLHREFVWVADNSAADVEFESVSNVPLNATAVFSFHIKEICIAGIQTPSNSTHFSLQIDNISGMSNTTLSNVNRLQDRFVVTVTPGQSNVSINWNSPQLVMQGKGIGIEKVKVNLRSEDGCKWSKAVVKFSVMYSDVVRRKTDFLRLKELPAELYY
jgi:hypothetical protein